MSKYSKTLRFLFVKAAFVSVLFVFGQVLSFAQCKTMYVSPTGDGAGTKSDPANIEVAFELADSGTTLLLAVGYYEIDYTLEIPDGVNIEGGYLPDSNWAKLSSPSGTWIHRTNANPGYYTQDLTSYLIALRGVSISNFSIRNLYITTADGIQNGRTTYGIWLRSCSNYKIVRTIIAPGDGYNGKDGVNGVDGNDGRDGIRGENGDDDNQNGEGKGGNGGQGGGGAQGGTAPTRSGCCYPGITGNPGNTSTTSRNGGGGGAGGGGSQGDMDGGNGGTGGGVNGVFGINGNYGVRGLASDCGGLCGKPGGNGSYGFDGTSYTNTSNSTMGLFFSRALDGKDGKDGTGGQGGAGGGGGSGEEGFLCIDGGGSGGGGGGGGGQGGTGGTGGESGGGSFSLYCYANGANAHIIQCDFRSGLAGKGGSGSIGGVGGSGGNGGLGGTTSGEVGCGGRGGYGGNGGRGGKGAEGKPGASREVFVASNGTALVTADTNSVLGPPVIISHASCANEESKFVAPSSGSWTFDGGADPNNANGQVVNAIFSEVGYHDVTFSGNTYKEFVWINPQSSDKPEAGQDQVICYGETAHLSAVAPTMGSGKWVSLGSAQIANEDTNSTLAESLSVGDNLFVWTTLSECCPDLTDTVNIHMYPESRDTIHPESCFTYESPGGKIYNSPGQFIFWDTITNSTGCDSIILVDLEVKTVNNGVVKYNHTALQADEEGGLYQWLDCGNNYAVISGETNRLFITSEKGSFAVEIQKDGCKDTSLCLSLDPLGIINNSIDPLMTVYPNPTSRYLNIDLTLQVDQLNVEIFNAQGSSVYLANYTLTNDIKIDCTGLAAGIYMLHLRSTGSGEALVRFVINDK